MSAGQRREGQVSRWLSQCWEKVVSQPGGGGGRLYVSVPFPHGSVEGLEQLGGESSPLQYSEDEESLLGLPHQEGGV